MTTTNTTGPRPTDSRCGRPTARRWRCGSRAADRLSCWCTGPRASTARSTPSYRRCAATSPPSPWTGGVPVPAGTWRPTPSSASSRTSPPSSTRSPPAAAGRSRSWGHSYGCNPAMGGAALTANVSHLMLYEPSFGLAYPAGSIEAMEAAVAAGDREAAIRAALVETGVMTDEEFAAFKATPRWPRCSPSPARLPRMPGRAQLGVPARSVRRNQGSHAAPDRLRHRHRAGGPDPDRRRGDPGHVHPGARGARPLRLPDGSGPGRRDGPRLDHAGEPITLTCLRGAREVTATTCTTRPHRGAGHESPFEALKYYIKLV